MNRQSVTVSFRFRPWAFPLLVVGGVLGIGRLTDWTIAHGTYFDYGD